MVNELMCLALAVYFEAGNQPLIGKVAVAQNIMYRVEDGRYPATVCGVVTDYKQYSFYSDGKPEEPPQGNEIEEVAWQLSVNVAEAFLSEGGDGSHFEDVINGALHYHADYVTPDWSSGEYVKIGDHIFLSQINKGP